MEEFEKNKQSAGEKEKLSVSTGGKSKMKVKSQLMQQHNLFGEIRNAQATLDLAIPRAPLMGVIRDIALISKANLDGKLEHLFLFMKLLKTFLSTF